MSRKRSQLTLVRELLADGEAHTHHELYELSCVVHSRVSELRSVLRREELERDRHADQQLVASWNPVAHWPDPDPRTGEMIHWYRLVPLWEHARELEASTAGTAAAAVVETGQPAARPEGAVALPGAPVPHGRARPDSAASVPLVESQPTVARGEPVERIPAGPPGPGATVSGSGWAGSGAAASGPAAAAELPVDFGEQLLLEREFEGARELEADAA